MYWVHSYLFCQEKVVLATLSKKHLGVKSQVCLYSSYDMVCWVPLGGIAGSCVGFIRSGEKRTLTLPRPWRGEALARHNQMSWLVNLPPPNVPPPEIRPY